MTRPMAVVLAAVFVLAAATVIVDRLPPTIPASATATPIAHVGPGPDGSSGQGECLDRLGSGSGWEDLCWQAYRAFDDADPTKDYYVLHTYGSFQGLRWLVVRADLVGEPAGEVFISWPEGRYEGACRDVPVELTIFPNPLPAELVCGRTIASSAQRAWSGEVQWSCEDCLLPDDATRPVTLYNAVAVPEGTLPSWDLYAAAGS